MKRDPQRSLNFAVRMTRLFGVLLVALGLLTIVAGLQSMRAGSAPPIPWMLFAGMVYLVCSIFLARRKTWAAVLAMCVVACNLLVMLLAMVMFAYFQPWREAPWSLLPLGAMLIFLIALAVLEYHLWRSLPATRTPPVEANRGFEPLPAAPATPAVPVVGPGEAHHGSANG